MAGSYTYNPYSPQQNAYGNPVSNGYAGARTQGSIANAAIQGTASGGTGSAAHDAFGAAAAEWSRVLGKRQGAQPTPSATDPRKRYYDSISGGSRPSEPPVISHDDAYSQYLAEYTHRHNYLAGLMSGATATSPGFAAYDAGLQVPPSLGGGGSLPGAAAPPEGSWSLPPSSGPSPSLPGAEAPPYGTWTTQPPRNVPPLPPSDSLPPSSSVPTTKRTVLATNSVVGTPVAPQAPGELQIPPGMQMPPQPARIAAAAFDGPLQNDLPSPDGGNGGNGGNGSPGGNPANPTAPPPPGAADPQFDKLRMTPGFQNVTQGALGEYRAWVAANHADGVDLVDWLYYQHPEMLGDEGKALRGRNATLDQRAKGMDTYKLFMQPSYQPTIPGKDKTKEAGPNPTRPEDANGAADRYAQTPGFELLKGRGDIVQEYRNWVVSDMKGRSGVDVVDWLINKHPELVGPEGMKLLGRQANGLDTYKWAAPGIPRMGEAPTSGSGADQDPYKAPARPIHKAPKPTSAPDPTAPPTTPPGGTPPVTPPGPTKNPDGSIKPVVPSETPYKPEPGELQLPPSLAEQLMKGMSPTFQWEQKELNRRLNAQAGFTGDSNAGGFGNVRGNANSQLVADQGKRVTDYVQQADQAERDRQLKVREMDLTAEIQKYGIDKNDSLQRWLNDPHNDTLQKYGIDKNDLLQRYQAQLQLQGIQYSSDAQVNAAALHAAAAGAAAAVDAQREQDNYNLGLKRLGMEDIFNQRGYDLGVLGINRDIYQADQADRYRYDYLKYLMSPEYRFGNNLPFVPPNQTPYGG